MSKLCIYHKGCLDGFAAVWVVNQCFNGIEDVEFIPAKYGDDPPDVTGLNVIIVDYSYPRDVLIEMNRRATSLLVLDHHKSARKDLESLDFARFDMDKAGCIMAWEYFFSGKQPPLFLDYIQDRDLWKFELPMSREINAAMFSYPMDFEVWDTFDSMVNLNKLACEGAAILRDRQQRIDSLTAGWAVSTETIGGYEVPCLNCPRWLASDVLHILSKGQPFAAGYFDTPEARLFELRSSEDGVDVSEVARQYGGGGHYHAAGFSMPRPVVI